MNIFNINYQNFTLNLKSPTIINSIIANEVKEEHEETNVFIIINNKHIPFCTLIRNKLDSIYFNMIVGHDINFFVSNKNSITIIGRPAFKKISEDHDTTKYKLIHYYINKNTTIHIKNKTNFFLATTVTKNRISLIVDINNMDHTLCNLSQQIPNSTIEFRVEEDNYLKFNIIGIGQIIIWGYTE